MRLPTLFALMICLPASAQEPADYARARILLHEPGHGMARLAELGLALDHGEHENGRSFTGDFSRAELELARADGFGVDVLIDDVQAFYRARAHEPAPAQRGGAAACNPPDAWPEPANWQLGSMAGFFTLEEIEGQLDAMRAAFPQLISQKATIGTSHEGRPIHMVRLSSEADQDLDRPELLYTALHHAREPVSASQLIYFMWHLLENYGSDGEATYVLDHFELHVVPCVNPDGYAYNQAISPEGGGLWRKNRRENGDGTFGVDLNRNYGHLWGLNNQGSSPNPSSEVYRGPAPFSEPETQAIRDLCAQHQFRMALNYHSHGNLIVYPWGHSPGAYTPDSAQFVRCALSMARDSRYFFGTANQTVGYVVNGSSDDWMYGEQLEKPKILACTPECGGPSDWFWPPQWRITEICRENLRQNLRAAELCGVYAETEDRNPPFLPSPSTHARFAVKRIGLEAGPITVSVEPVLNVADVGDPITFTSLAELEERLDSIAISLAAGLQPGDPVAYDLVAGNGGFAWRTRVEKRFGQAVILLDEGFASTGSWWVEQWATTDDASAADPPAIADSPSGPYPPQSYNTLTLAQPADLSNSAAARLTFRARWAIEGWHDGLVVMGSSDGVSWATLCGRYSRPGQIDDPEAIAVHDAQMPHWAQEEIDLQPFVGGPFHVRFTLASNDSRQYDGCFLDDVKVLGAQLISGMERQASEARLSLSPNPARDVVRIRAARTAAEQPRALQLLDAVGRIVLQQTWPDGADALELPTDGMAEGLYQCRILSANGNLGPKPLVISR
ncbi:MAG: M14 family zinc carboxypeptidase [Flavobacteriales bacterium]